MPTGPAAVLSVRVNASERALLEAAAEHASTSLSDFVRRRALEAAESDPLDRRIVTIAAKDWARFEAWASALAREVPALRKLSTTRPVWQKGPPAQRPPSPGRDPWRPMTTRRRSIADATR